MANQGVSVTPEALRDKFEEINQLDIRLDAVGGSGTRGKRAIGNEIVLAHQDDTSKFVDSVLKNVTEKFEGEVQVAAYLSVVRRLEDELGKVVDEYLEKAVEERKSDAPALSDEEVTRLEESRKELVTQYNALRNILEMFGTDVSDIPEPRSRRGRRGPRGPKTLSQFQYSLDGEELDDENNSLSYVASKTDLSTKELKEFIQGQGVSLSKDDIPDDWEVKLPNGSTLAATRTMNRRDEEENEEEAA